MSTSYIPSRDADFSNWLLNFSTLVTANYAAYGLTAANAASISAQNASFQAAYSLAIDPSTRTPSTVATKDAARALAVAVVRPFAMAINANNGVTNGQRAALGLTVRKTVPTPIPAPTSAPAVQLVAGFPGQLQLQYKNPAAPDGKAKPYGATHVQIAYSTGLTAAVDPSQAQTVLSITKSPFALDLPQASSGKIVSIFARFTTRSGPGGVSQAGPWSAPISCYAM